MKNTCVVKVSSELDKSKVTAVRNGKDIRVNWSKVNHAESYVVTRYNKLTANDEVIYEGTATACEDKDLPSGKYVYIVKAIVDKNDASADLYLSLIHILSMLLALTMLFSSQAFSESVLAASAATSTDAIDGSDEATTHAEVFFVNKANGNLITVDVYKRQLCMKGTSALMKCKIP